MAAYALGPDIKRPLALGSHNLLIREVHRGLSARPRSLAPWMFYDARGSCIFECITQLQEYYPTRMERNILTSFSADIIAAACCNRSKSMRLVELGAGTASKTTILLNAAARLQDEVLYTPIDVSPDALEVARERIAASSPEVCVAPIVANYVTDPPQLESFHGVTLGLYIGSSIGNFEPDERRTILRNLRSQLQAGDALLLGVDMVKDESTLVAAYDDSDGVTAEFNLNILSRLNRELGANFIPANFRHRAVWRPERSRIEMHLESTCGQWVRIPAAEVEVYFKKRETIHTENSYKFTRETVRVLLGDAGFEVEHTWKDRLGWYSVTLARIR